MKVIETAAYKLAKATSPEIKALECQIETLKDKKSFLPKQIDILRKELEYIPQQINALEKQLSALRSAK
jgi:predicted  nucleic acid-binding Zn-ribbon protein